MKKPILNLEIMSPAELDNTLSSITQGSNHTDHQVALNLFGPQILVRQFDLPPLTKREIKNAIKLEATEVFSLLPEEIEIDYQILDSSKDKIKGVFTAIPKTLLNDYISRIDKAKLTPLKLSANILSRINYFLKENAIENKNVCLIDFYKANIINIAIFDNKECRLLREINYENLNDAEREIMYSLKYTSGRSANKQFDAIYLLGDSTGKDDIIANLKQELNTEVKNYSIDSQLNDGLTELFFNIDLINGNRISPSLRRKLLFASNSVLIISLLLFLFFSIITNLQNKEIKNLSASYKPSDYGYAKGLQQKLGSLKNAK